MDVLIPSYTSYLAVISLPYHKRATWRYTFSGGGNHSPTILTSHKTEVCFFVFGVFVLHVGCFGGFWDSCTVFKASRCFKILLPIQFSFLLAAPFQNKRETKKPKKARVVWLLLFGIFCLHSCREALADQKLSIRAFELVHEMMLGVMVHGWTLFARLVSLLVEDEYI